MSCKTCEENLKKIIHLEKNLADAKKKHQSINNEIIKSNVKYHKSTIELQQRIKQLEEENKLLKEELAKLKTEISYFHQSVNTESELINQEQNINELEKEKETTKSLKRKKNKETEFIPSKLKKIEKETIGKENVSLNQVRVPPVALSPSKQPPLPKTLKFKQQK